MLQQVHGKVCESAKNFEGMDDGECGSAEKGSKGGVAVLWY